MNRLTWCSSVVANGLYVFLVMLLVLQFAPPVSATAPEVENLTLQETVVRVNDKLRQRFGVGIEALGLLTTARRGVFTLVDSLRESGQYNLVNELENNGFIKMRIIPAQEGELIEMVPTEKGVAMIEALRNAEK